MDLTWIGTRTQNRHRFEPGGIGATKQADAVPEVLARGSLLIEARIEPRAHPVNLLRFAALAPWPTGLTVCLEPDGTLRLLLRQGARDIAVALRTTLGRDVEVVHITYHWDAPGRIGRLSVHAPDSNAMWQVAVPAPFPIMLHDVQRIISGTNQVMIDPGVNFLAMATGLCPIGPLPTLAGQSEVETPAGPVAIHSLQPGDLVCVQGNQPPAPVLWTGSVDLPALGRFTPLVLRQPYLGLWDNLICARDQRIQLSGTEIEYTFGETQVSTALRHLEPRHCVAPMGNPPACIRYYQILLPDHQQIRVNGTWIDSFNSASITKASIDLGATILHDMPADLLPEQTQPTVPALQGFEALSLTESLMR